ncbi:hypothetical protein MJH12_20180 [bacterium]|nr:hypothetical protein [bacterium]
MKRNNSIIYYLNNLYTTLFKTFPMADVRSNSKLPVFFCNFLVFLLLFSVPYGATSQVIEFSGSVVHPADGAYNQVISIRVQIIKRVLYPEPDMAAEDIETILWSKTYDEVQIHNGQYSLTFDKDDDDVPIGATIFETKLEYEYKTSAEVDRANLPDGNYSLRFYMRRTQNEEWERIKPDFTIDSAPYSVSALKLSGADTKAGNLIIQAIPGVDENNIIQTGAVLTLDTQPDAESAKNLAAGFYMENGTLNISMGTSNNKAIDMEGTLYLKDSLLEIEESLTINEGNLIFERLCMSLNCESSAFKNILRANQLVLMDNFIDNGSTDEYIYNLQPSGVSTFQSLSLMNLETGINGTLHLKGEANIDLKYYAGLQIEGNKANLSLLSGNINMDTGAHFSNLISKHFQLEDSSNKLRDEELDSYADPKYFKVIASKLRSSNFTNGLSPYFVKPSTTSNIRALKFHFYDKDKARLRIDARVSSHRFPTTAAKHKVNVLFDPVFTEEIYNGLISGGVFDFHNHDLISQASETELMDIINSSEFTDSNTIDLEFIDASLMKETYDNIWTKQTSFYALLPTGVDGDKFSSLKIRNNIEVSAGNPDIAEPRVIFGGVQDQFDLDFPYIFPNFTERKSYGFFGTRSPEKRDIYFYYKNIRLNMKAGGLTLDKEFRLSPSATLFAQMTVYGETRISGDLIVEEDLEIDGALIAGCFGINNVTAATSVSCLEMSTVSASTLINISTLTATIFTDKALGNDNTLRFFDANAHSIVEDILIQKAFVFSGNTNIDAPITVESDFNAEIGTVGTTNEYIASSDFSTIVTGPLYVFDPNKISFISDLNVSESVDVKYDLIHSSTTATVTISSSLHTTSLQIMGVTTIDLGYVTAQSLTDFTNGSRYLDPDGNSEMGSMQLDGNFLLNGNTTINGNLTLNTGMITISQNLVFGGVVRDSSNIIDFNNPAFSADPDQISSFNAINFTSILKSSYLTARNVTIGSALDVGGDAYFDTTLLIDKKTEVLQM